MIFDPPPLDFAAISAALPVASAARIANIHVSPRPGLWRWSVNHVLGTELDILVNSYDDLAVDLAAKAIHREIARLDRVLSAWREDSELSKLNRVHGAIVSPDLFYVLKRAEAWRSITKGAFDARIGSILSSWRQGRTTGSVGGLGVPELNVVTRWVTRPEGVIFALDGIAKGYILDRALAAGRAATSGLSGLLINIGGDIVAWGTAPERRPWHVGLDDLVCYGAATQINSFVELRDAAFATSGKGPRDFKINGARASATLSPRTGAPAAFNISANVLAPSATDADALATALLATSAEEGLAQLASWRDIAARVVDAEGREHQTENRPQLTQAKATSASETKITSLSTAVSSKANATISKVAAADVATPAIPPEQRWPRDWNLFIDYAAPAGGSSFFMAAWMSDARTKKPIRTLILIGKEAKWQKENFVWWGNYSEQAEHIVDVRAQTTSKSGEYPTYWAGVDDAFQAVPIGDYILNIETSREHGDHLLFSTPVTIGKERFEITIPSGPTGAATLRYLPYNER